MTVGAALLEREIFLEGERLSSLGRRLVPGRRLGNAPALLQGFSQPGGQLPLLRLRQPADESRDLIVHAHGYRLL
jgi:hypothetical protein